MQKEQIVIEDGTVSWFYGEQVPAGFYWVVLDVSAEFERESPVDDKWFTAQWQGAILTAGSVVKKSSPKFAPRVGASFVQRGNPRAYKLKLRCFYSFEEAEKFVESGQADAGWMATYAWTWMHTVELSNVKFVQERKIQGITFDKVWLDESAEIDIGYWDFKTLRSHFNEQTSQQRIAQRQVDLNAAKITKLEKELKDLRELQKLLKGLR